MNKKLILIILLFSIFNQITYSQISPTPFENVESLITFGKEADDTWGDDDHSQVHFFVIPKTETKSVYIRVYDPDISGDLDTKNNTFNTTTSFVIYGGKGAYSIKAARSIDPIPGYDKGKVLYKKIFGSELTYNNKWYTFGPINPKEGEYSEQFNGYIFKMICTGLTGDDGNAYRYSLSYKKDRNIEIENGNVFTYEMSFKLYRNKAQVAHVYPFITKDIKSITVRNFDADNDIFIRLTSIARKLVNSKVSLDGLWSSSTFLIDDKEINSSIDIQLSKKTNSKYSNDMVVCILNQYKETMPLFTIPIGGKPKYLYKVKVKYKF